MHHKFPIYDIPLSASRDDINRPIRWTLGNHDNDADSRTKLKFLNFPRRHLIQSTSASFFFKWTEFLRCNPHDSDQNSPSFFLRRNMGNSTEAQSLVQSWRFNAFDAMSYLWPLFFMIHYDVIWPLVFIMNLRCPDVVLKPPSIIWIVRWTRYDGRIDVSHL